jgi:hypothetical protein
MSDILCLLWFCIPPERLCSFFYVWKILNFWFLCTFHQKQKSRTLYLSRSYSRIWNALYYSNITFDLRNLFCIPKSWRPELTQQFVMANLIPFTISSKRYTFTFAYMICFPDICLVSGVPLPRERADLPGSFQRLKKFVFYLINVVSLTISPPPTPTFHRFLSVSLFNGFINAIRIQVGTK